MTCVAMQDIYLKTLSQVRSKSFFPPKLKQQLSSVDLFFYLQ